MNQKKVIAIDHGNRNMKTLNYTFPSSYLESGHLPTFGDVLVYGGKEYTLIDQRMPQKTDKTKDDSYFILTLFAIGKELAGKTALDECIDVELLVGLPPLHCKEMSQRFAKYFKNNGNEIRFELNKIPHIIRITEVYVYPQAYAAVMTVREQIKDSPIVNLIDIGGYTVDLLQLVSLRPNMSVCTSLYGGVNSMFQKINEQVRAKGAMNVPDSIIEGILRGNKKILSTCSNERIELVQSNAQQFAYDMVLSISQSGLDLAENKTVFVGGGSILLRKFIKSTKLVSKSIFVDSVRANAKGYQLLYDNRKSLQAQTSST